MSQAKWLNCRLSDIRRELPARSHPLSKPLISRLLRAQDYSLRANLKQEAGKQHPERDTQFHYIRTQRAADLESGQAVISVDTKKKQLIGNFKNSARICVKKPKVLMRMIFPTMHSGERCPTGSTMWATTGGRSMLGRRPIHRPLRSTRLPTAARPNCLSAFHTLHAC
jgi:Rhodopirellula transposase DDE domain